MCERCGRDTAFVVVGGEEGRARVGRGPAVDAMRLVRMREISDGSAGRPVHTLCARCTEEVVSRIKEHSRVQEQERSEYQRVTEAIKAHPLSFVSPSPEDMSRLADEERRAMEENAAAQRDLEDVRSQLEVLNARERSLAFAERSHWAEMARFSEAVELCRETVETLQAEAERLSCLTRQLSAVNVHREAFQIGTASGQGGVAVINGCRLGRIPGGAGGQVDVDEINAAWGHAALLLYSIAHKIRLPFSVYHIVPLGCRSSLRVRVSAAGTGSSGGVEGAVYPLYSVEELRFVKGPSVSPTVAVKSPTMAPGTPLVGHSPSGSGSSAAPGFDDGMEAFLRCLAETVAHCKALDPSVKLPCTIDRDRIQWKDSPLVSVRVTNNTEERWSKALKYTLAILNRVLAHLPKLLRSQSPQTRSPL